MFEFTEHFKNVIQRRSIDLLWVQETLKSPDIVENRNDGTRHYLKQIETFEKRWLRVVVGLGVSKKLITAFFDRRIRRSS